MNTKDADVLAEKLEAVIRDTMHHGRNQTVLEFEPLPGGLTQIDGTFDLSVVARACLDEMRKAGFQLAHAK